MSLRDGTFKRERWKYFNRYYHVSDRGRVYSDLSHKILRPIINQHGYKRLTLKAEDGSFKTYRVNRVVAELFVPNPDNLPEVNHLNGIKTDNRASNLEWCTPSRNNQHAWDTGLHKKALTDNDVKEIKDTYENTSLSTYDLAKKFGVCQRTIHKYTSNINPKVKKKKKWQKISKDVKDKICEEYKTGKYTQTQLAERFGVSIASVCLIVKGVEPLDIRDSRAKLSKNEREHLYDLYKNGTYSKTELAKLYGISFRNVWYYIRKFEETDE